MLSGLQQGGNAVVEGVKGVVVQPLQGSKQGPRGTIKGIYKGLSGLLFKPLTGLLDLTSATAEGLREVFLALPAPSVRKRLPRPFYSATAYYAKYNPTDAATMSIVLTQSGYQIFLIEKVNLGFEKLVVCVEGVLLADEKSITWRKNIEFLFGCVPGAKTCSIEYFELGEGTINYASKVIDIQSRASGERIAAAVRRAVQNYSQMVNECDAVGGVKE